MTDSEMASLRKKSGYFIIKRKNQCSCGTGVLVLRPSEVESAMEKALDKRLRQEATIREMQETGKILVKVKK